MIEATFQLAPGVGPYRERQLWDAGVVDWDAFLRAAAPAAGAPLGASLGGRLRAAVQGARDALRDADAGRLAGMLPRRERWRMYPAFEDDTAFVDVEGDGHDLTVVGVLDRNGPRVFVRGRDLERFPAAAAAWKLLVTFNGHAFDVPALRRTFPDWTPPRAHVDLAHLWGRLGHRGGLKALEEATGVGRPDHLRGIGGAQVVSLWRRHENGDASALRHLAEYNLYDTVNLRSLMTIAYDRMLERYRLPAAPIPIWRRGDVLYDMTRQLAAL